MFRHSGFGPASASVEDSNEMDASVFYPQLHSNEDTTNPAGWLEDVQAWHAAFWRAALLRNAFTAACAGGFNCSDANAREDTPAFQQLPTVSSDTLMHQNAEIAMPESLQSEETARARPSLLVFCNGIRGLDDAGVHQQDVFLCTLPMKLADGQRMNISADEANFEVTVNTAKAIIYPTASHPEQTSDQKITSRDIFRRPAATSDLCTNPVQSLQFERPDVSCNRDIPTDSTLPNLSPQQTAGPLSGIHCGNYSPAHVYGSVRAVPREFMRSIQPVKTWTRSFGNRKRARSMQFSANIRLRKREMSIAQAASPIERRATSSDPLRQSFDDGHNSLTTKDNLLSAVDGVNLEEIKRFAKVFKMKRLALGLTQTQVGQTLSLTNGPAYSQSAICRFEKLDITPKSAQKIKPVLERWLQEVDNKIKSNGNIANVQRTIFSPVHAETNAQHEELVPMPRVQLPRQPTDSQIAHKSQANDATSTDEVNCESSAENAANCKRRKRRTSFAPQALEILNDYFEHNSHPSGIEMTSLAERLNYDREVIRVWFCNKRQALKNTFKKLKMSPC